MSITVAYALTTNALDEHAGLNLLSALSVKFHNPEARILVVCDRSSAKALAVKCHPLREVCDSVIAVDTPEMDPSFRNRFVKTRLRHFIHGTFLYLDGDTIVRGSLQPIFERHLEMGSVPNHNGLGVASEIPYEERQAFERMQWALPSRYYVNGGVHLFADNARVRRFFDTWHENWLQSASVTGRHFDQPALNATLDRSDIQFGWLPHECNAQVHARPATARGALIWHSYNSGHNLTPPTHMDVLLERLRLGIRPTDREIRSLTSKVHPWVAKNALGWIAATSLSLQKELLVPNQWQCLVLQGKHRQGVGCLLRKSMPSVWSYFRSIIDRWRHLKNG
jgi:hypothetical protein